MSKLKPGAFDDDISNLTDSDSESDGDSLDSGNGMFGIPPMVLELHELDKGMNENAPGPEAKSKKHRKKKKTHPTENDSNISQSSSALDVERHKEEFYDAHESYHALPEHQQSNPIAQTTLTLAASNHEVPKLDEEETEPATTRQPLAETLSKPVLPPE